MLQPDAATGDLIRLEWRHTDNDRFADAAMMSDGTLRFLCLATVLLQPDPPSVVLIDEPELGLHPYAINQLAELMKAASNTCQVVVSTQSVTLLDQIGTAFLATQVLFRDRRRDPVDYGERGTTPRQFRLVERTHVEHDRPGLT